MDDTIVTHSRVEDILVELSLLNDFEQRELNVALLSDSDDLKKLNYFIFNSVENINYHTIDTPYDNDLSILSQMDIVIFNKEDKNLENLILENIANKHLHCKFFCLVDEKSYRKVDFLNEYLHGVSKVIRVENELEEYIFEIQRELRCNFYSQRLRKIEAVDTLFQRDDFESRIKNLIDERVCFTKLRYTYDSDLDIAKYNLRKILRDKDTIYIDRQKSEIYFLLLDVMPSKADSIIKSRVKNFSIRLSEISHESVFDIVFS